MNHDNSPICTRAVFKEHEPVSCLLVGMSERQQGRCLAKVKEFCDKNLEPENAVKSVWNDVEDGSPHDYVVNTLSLLVVHRSPIPTVDQGIHIMIIFLPFCT